MLEKIEYETHDRDEAIAAMSQMAGGPLTVVGRGVLGLRTSGTRTETVIDARMTTDRDYRASNAPVDLLHIVTPTNALVLDVGGQQHVVEAGQTIHAPTHVTNGFHVLAGTTTVTALSGEVVREVARQAFIDAP